MVDDSDKIIQAQTDVSAMKVKALNCAEIQTFIDELLTLEAITDTGRSNVISAIVTTNATPNLANVIAELRAFENATDALLDEVRKHRQIATFIEQNFGE